MIRRGTLKPVGYWASEPSADAAARGDWICGLQVLVDHFRQLPRAIDHVNWSWDVVERAAVATYLERGREHMAYMGWSDCRICGRENGCLDLTDGVYVWPDGLAHYVRDHAVKPPADFVAHALRERAR